MTKIGEGMVSFRPSPENIISLPTIQETLDRQIMKTAERLEELRSIREKLPLEVLSMKQSDLCNLLLFP